MAYNPYHFVPVVPRDGDYDLTVADFDAGERRQARHDRYVPETYSGRIICRLTTESPLVLGAERTAGSPSTVRPFELGGRPAIPASSLRGLISSIAEAASNSALRVLENEVYSIRKTMGDSLSAIGMVIQHDDGSYHLRPLCLPMLPAAPNGATQPHRLANLFPRPNLKVYFGDYRLAAKPDRFDSYRHDSPQYYGLRLKNDRDWGSNHTLPFDDLQYRKPGAPGQQLVLGQRAEGAGDPVPWGGIPIEDRPCYVRGILRILGCEGRKDIPNKKHEIFIPYTEEMEQWDTVPISKEAVDRFHDLADRRTAARTKAPRLPYELKGTRRNPDSSQDDYRLKTGDLVYFNADAGKVTEICLSAIWRRGLPSRTHDFFRAVDPQLLPFHAGRERITPAEQLFGFVEQEAERGRAVDPNERRSARALAGRIRFSAATLHDIDGQDYSAWSPGCALPSPYDRLVRLKILDSPKPPCPSMYFKRAQGAPHYIAKAALNAQRHHPQGRKFYLHHSARGQWGTRREHSGENLEQKADVTPLRQESAFYFHLDFDNLSRHELGLLLYALRPLEDFRHKLGMGKALGLGSVRIDVEAVLGVDRGRRYTWDGLFEPRYRFAWLADGADTAAWPASCAATGLNSSNLPIDVPDLREAFRQGMNADIRNSLELLGISSLANVHTPLVQGRTDDEVETFAWFMANDNDWQRFFLEPLTAQTQRLPALGALADTAHQGGD